MGEVEYRCFVGGLALATTDQSLADVFGTYGQVTDSKIINDPETGRSKGFGFVTFANEQSMRDAIEGMNGQDVDGCQITVNEAQSHGSDGGDDGNSGGHGALGFSGNREIGSGGRLGFSGNRGIPGRS